MPRLSSLRALVDGVLAVVRAPLVVVAVAVSTMAMAMPFAVVLGSRLQIALSTQPPVDRGETEIDPEWWRAFRAQAQGLEATFTPAVLGFAATLDSISGVLDGRRPPFAVLGPLALSMAAWAFLWGGILRRFEVRRAIGPRAFIDAGIQHWPRFVVIAALAAAVIVVLYLTLHAALFGPVHRLLVPFAPTERGAFLVRVLLYVTFFAPVAAVGLAADYARVASVLARANSLGQAVGQGVSFVRRNAGAVIALYLMTALVFVVVTIAYGILEISGGSPVGGWRAIAIGQAYILVRLAIRLTVAASELRLFAAHATP